MLAERTSPGSPHAADSRQASVLISGVSATQPAYLLPTLIKAAAADGRALEPDEGLESELRRAWEGARRAHPGVSLNWRRFAPALARRMRLDAPAASLAKLRVDDLFLARAVLAGDSTAGERFDALLDTVVAEMNLERETEGLPPMGVAAVSRLCRSFLVGEGRRPGLARYRGRGRLKSWVIAEAQRQLASRPTMADTVVDAPRAPRPPRPLKLVSVSHDETATFQAPRLPRPKARVAPADEPELLRRAFVAAIAKLPQSERALLQRYYVEGQTLNGSDKASAPRDVAAAKRALLKRTRTELLSRASLGQRDLDRLIGHLTAGLGVHLGRRVAERAGAVPS